MWSATVQSDDTVWPSVAGHALPEPVLGLATVYVWDFVKVEASQVDQQLQDPTQSLQARVSRVPEAVGHDEPLPILVFVTVYVRSSWSLAQEDQAEKLPTQLRLVPVASLVRNEGKALEQLFLDVDQVLVSSFLFCVFCVFCCCCFRPSYRPIG